MWRPPVAQRGKINFARRDGCRLPVHGMNFAGLKHDVVRIVLAMNDGLRKRHQRGDLILETPAERREPWEPLAQMIAKAARSLRPSCIIRSIVNREERGTCRTRLICGMKSSDPAGRQLHRFQTGYLPYTQALGQILEDQPGASRLLVQEPEIGRAHV